MEKDWEFEIKKYNSYHCQSWIEIAANCLVEREKEPYSAHGKIKFKRVQLYYKKNVADLAQKNSFNLIFKSRYFLTTVGPSHHCCLPSQIRGAVLEVPEIKLMPDLHT